MGGGGVGVGMTDCVKEGVTERENLNSKTLFYKDCRERERETDRDRDRETDRDRQTDRQTDSERRGGGGGENESMNE